MALTVLVQRDRAALGLNVVLWATSKPPTLGPPVPHACPASRETPFHVFTMTTIALTSRTICDILAKCIGILRRSYRGGEKTHPTRAASLAQSIAGAGDEERRCTGRVDPAGLARCPAAGGCVSQAAHIVGSKTCVRPTLRDAAPLPSQWNVSPGVRGGGWALSATNRAYRAFCRHDILLAALHVISMVRAAVDNGSACVARAPRHTRYLISKSK